MLHLLFFVLALMNPWFKAPPSMLSNPNQTHPPCHMTNRCMLGVTIKWGRNVEHIFVFSALVIFFFFLLLIPQEVFQAFYILYSCWCLLHWHDVHGLFELLHWRRWLYTYAANVRLQKGIYCWFRQQAVRVMLFCYILACSFICRLTVLLYILYKTFYYSFHPLDDVNVTLHSLVLLFVL